MNNINKEAAGFPLVSLIPTGTDLDQFASDFEIDGQTFTQYPFAYQQDADKPQSYNLMIASDSKQALGAGLQDMCDSLGHAQIANVIVLKDDGGLEVKELPVLQLVEYDKVTAIASGTAGVTAEDVLISWSVDINFGTMHVLPSKGIVGFFVTGERANANRRPR